MRIYVGQTRAADLTRRLWRMGIGECTARGELPPRRRPWFYDNGAFGDWKAGRPFDVAAFLADIESIYLSIDRPEFIVLPDLVACGEASLVESLRWVHRLRGLAPLYLAVQDGMTSAMLRGSLRDVAGLFVGGTLDWKLRTAGSWTEFARRHDLRCHVGRCGTFNRVRWAMRIGADSMDSSLPLWSKENMDRFLGALEPHPQIELSMAEAA